MAARRRAGCDALPATAQPKSSSGRTPAREIVPGTDVNDVPLVALLADAGDDSAFPLAASFFVDEDATIPAAIEVKTLSLTVKTLSGKALNIRVPNTCRWPDVLKAMVKADAGPGGQSEFARTWGRFTMIYKGKRQDMGDPRTVGQAGIEDGGTLFLVKKLSAGPMDAGARGGAAAVVSSGMGASAGPAAGVRAGADNRGRNRGADRGAGRGGGGAGAGGALATAPAAPAAARAEHRKTRSPASPTSSGTRSTTYSTSTTATATKVRTTATPMGRIRGERRPTARSSAGRAAAPARATRAARGKRGADSNGA